MCNSQRELKPFSKYLLTVSCVQDMMQNNTIARLTSSINSLINPFTKDLIIKQKVCPPNMRMS